MLNQNLIDEIVVDNKSIRDKTEIKSLNNNIQESSINDHISNGNNGLKELRTIKEEEVNFNQNYEIDKIFYSTLISQKKESNISTLKANDLQNKPQSALNENIYPKNLKEKEFEVPEKLFIEKLKNYKNQNNGVTDYLKNLEENFQLISSKKNKDENKNSEEKSRFNKYYETGEPNKFCFLHENMCNTLYLDDYRSPKKSRDSQFFQNILNQFENEKVNKIFNFTLENANTNDNHLAPVNSKIDCKDFIKNENVFSKSIKLGNVEVSNDSDREVEIDFDKNNDKNYPYNDYQGYINDFNQKKAILKHYKSNLQKKNNSALIPISNFSQFSNLKYIDSNTGANTKAKQLNEQISNVSTDPNTNSKPLSNKNYSNLFYESVNQNIKRKSSIENYKKSNIVPNINLNSLISNNNYTDKSEKDNNLNYNKNKDVMYISNNFNNEIPLNQENKNIGIFKEENHNVNLIDEEICMKDYILNINTRTVYIDPDEASQLEMEENYDNVLSPINRYAYMYLNDLPVSESIRYDSVNPNSILKKDSASSDNYINNNYINQPSFHNSILIANNAKNFNYENTNFIENVQKIEFSQQINFTRTFSDNIDDYLTIQEKAIDHEELNAFFSLLKRRYENYMKYFLTEIKHCKLFDNESAFSTISSVSSLEYYIEVKFEELLKARKPICNIESIEKIFFKWRNIKADNNSFYRAVIHSYIENILLSDNDLNFLILIKEIVEVMDKIEYKKIYSDYDINSDFLIGSLFFILYAKNVKNFNESYSTFEYLELFMNYSSDFDLGLVLFLKIKIHDFIEKNKSKIYSKQFNVKLGELLPLMYIDQYNNFLWEKFYEENLLKLGNEAGKLSKYLIPFILNINLKIFSYEYEKVNSEDFNNFGYQNPEWHTALLFSKNNHYDLAYSKNYFGNVKDKLIRFPVNEKTNVNIEDLKNMEKTTYLNSQDLSKKNENQSYFNEEKKKINSIKSFSKINNHESFYPNSYEKMSLKISDENQRDNIVGNNNNLIFKDGRFLSNYRHSKDDSFQNINLYTKIDNKNYSYTNRKEEMESRNNERKKNSISFDVRKRTKNNALFENNSYIKPVSNNQFQRETKFNINAINNKNYLLARSQIDYDYLKLEKPCNVDKDIDFDKIKNVLVNQINNSLETIYFNGYEDNNLKEKRTGKMNETGEHLLEDKGIEIENANSDSFRKSVCNLCNAEFDKRISNFLRTFICKSCFDNELLKDVSSKITPSIESSLLELLDNRLKPFDLTYPLRETETITVLDVKNEIKFYKQKFQINFEEIVEKIISENCLMCLLDKSRYCNTKMNYVLPCKCKFSSLIHFRIFLTKIIYINIENKAHENFTCVCNTIYSADQLIKIFEIINENEFQHEFQMLKNYLQENVFKNFCCICRKSIYEKKYNLIKKEYNLKDSKFEREMRFSDFSHFSCFECTKIINRNINLASLYESNSTFNCNLCIRQHIYVSDSTN